MTIYNRPDASVPVWAEAGDRVQPTNPEVQTGWPLSNVPPSRQRFNWILNAVAEAVRYVLQRGVAEWSADEDYPTNGRVQYLGVTYRALIDSPTAAPGVVDGEWELWGFSDTTLLPRVDSILNKSVAGGVDVVLTAAEANNGILNFTGVLTGNINVVVPNVARRYVVRNNTTGAFTLSLKTASGAAVPVAQGVSVALFCDGANGIVSQNILVTTPAQFNDSTAIATTEFVRRFGITARALTAVTASATLNATHIGAALAISGSGTITLPAANSVPSGAAISLLNNNGSTTWDLVRAGSDTVQFGGSGVTSLTVAGGHSFIAVSNGSNAWFLYAGLLPAGVGQTWQDVTASRVLATTYTNTTGRPITVAIQTSQPGGSVTRFNLANGAPVTFVELGSPSINGQCPYPAILIPPGWSYSLTSVAGANSIVKWWELR